MKSGSAIQAGEYPAPDVYDRLGSDGREAISSGLHRSDPLPVECDRRWGLSVVIKLHGETARRLTSAQRTMSKLSHTAHARYAPHGLHVTVRSLEGYRSDVPVAHVRAWAEDTARRRR